MTPVEKKARQYLSRANLEGHTANSAGYAFEAGYALALREAAAAVEAVRDVASLLGPYAGADDALKALLSLREAQGGAE